MAALSSRQEPLDRDHRDTLVRTAALQRMAQLAAEMATLVVALERAKDRDEAAREEEKRHQERVGEMFKPVKFSRRNLRFSLCACVSVWVLCVLGARCNWQGVRLHLW